MNMVKCDYVEVKTVDGQKTSFTDCQFILDNVEQPTTVNVYEDGHAFVFNWDFVVGYTIKRSKEQ